MNPYLEELILEEIAKNGELVRELYLEKSAVGGLIWRAPLAALLGVGGWQAGTGLYNLLREYGYTFPGALSNLALTSLGVTAALKTLFPGR